MENLKYSLQAIGAVINRNVQVWLKLLMPVVAANIVNPILFLFSFGFGLGAVMQQAGVENYLAYVVPGMMTYGVLFSASFETTIGTYTRLQTLRVIDAMLASPIKLYEVVLGEIAGAALKGTVAAAGVMLAAAVFGGIPLAANVALLLPLMLLGGAVFAAVGLVFTAYARGYEFFHYFFTFWVTPNFLFTGVFFSMERFPLWLNLASWSLPARHLIELARPLTTHTPYNTAQLLLSLGYISAMLLAGYLLAYRRFKARLFD